MFIRHNKVSKFLDKANKYKNVDWCYALGETITIYNAEGSEKCGYPIYDNRQLIDRMVSAIVNSLDFRANKDYAEEIVDKLTRAMNWLHGNADDNR